MMKIFYAFTLVFTISAIIFSCQKELKFESNGVSSGTLKKDAGGSCLPVTVTGIFSKDSVLSNQQYVDVQVNVNYPGTFDIRTDTVNGFWFNKAGSVTLGTNTIRLYASGTPTAAGTSTFTVTYGSSTCTFDITVVGPPPSPAVFTLGGAPNSCTGASVNGTYTVGTPLTPGNTLTIQVLVTSPGAYAIAAASTSGFLFSGTGLFTGTGLQNVTLTGTGTPLTAGNATVTVTNLSSTCTFDITVLPAGGSGGAATFTLDGTPNTCTSYLIGGTYTAGSVTSVANTVKLNVTATVAGTYTISTNTVNGISFSGSGSLVVGTQQITLTATGTPAAAGTFTYQPNVPGSCTFDVTTVPPPNGDYFPLTNNSWWSYDVTGGTDTAYSVIYGTNTYNSNTYSEMEDSYAGAPYDTTHYRKATNDYWQWSPTDYYSGYIAFDNVEYKDINFLRENAATNTAFTPQTFTGTFQGNPASMEYDFKVANANTSITVNSVNYTSVIYMSVTVKFTCAAFGLSNAVVENDDYYYAKGIGLVKVVYTPTAILTGATSAEVNLRNYHVF
ncbi:MAG: hypothetical protein JST86_07005 [Bacteroidetes bacterium]|nr:hypothetical protein [Bacteroidota bacterium]